MIDNMFSLSQRKFWPRIIVFLVILVNACSAVDYKRLSEIFYSNLYGNKEAIDDVNGRLIQNQETYDSWCKTVASNSKLDKVDGPHAILRSDISSRTDLLTFQAVRCIPYIKNSNSDKWEPSKNERFYLLPFNQDVFKLEPDNKGAENWANESLRVVSYTRLKGVSWNE